MNTNLMITKCSFCLMAHLDHDGYHCHKQYCYLTQEDINKMIQKIFSQGQK